MASKLTKLRMPQYSLRQPNGPAFTYFLKTVFEYNYQRKDLMAESRDVIINFWKNMVYSAYRGDIDRARLMKQTNGRRFLAIWEKYIPEEYPIYTGPRIEGTKPESINGRTIHVPTTWNSGVDRIDYIHFASTALPRVNPGRNLDRETTDEAWRLHVLNIFETRSLKHLKVKSPDILAQSKRRIVDQYWAQREAEQEASEQEVDEDI